MSLRNYLSVEELQDRRPNIAEVDLSVLEQAEKDIDLVTASFVEGANRKGYSSVLLLENVALNGTTATVPTLASTQGYYSYCILEVLSGANAGKRFFITTSSFSTNYNPNIQNSIRERVSPQALDLLGRYTTQSL